MTLRLLRRPERQTGEQTDAQKAGQKRNKTLALSHASHRRNSGLRLATEARASLNALTAGYRSNPWLAVAG